MKEDAEQEERRLKEDKLKQNEAQRRLKEDVEKEERGLKEDDED